MKTEEENGKQKNGNIFLQSSDGSDDAHANFVPTAKLDETSTLPREKRKEKRNQNTFSADPEPNDQTRQSPTNQNHDVHVHIRQQDSLNFVPSIAGINERNAWLLEMERRC